MQPKASDLRRTRNDKDMRLNKTSEEAPFTSAEKSSSTEKLRLRKEPEIKEVVLKQARLPPYAMPLKKRIGLQESQSNRIIEQPKLIREELPPIPRQSLLKPPTKLDSRLHKPLNSNSSHLESSRLQSSLVQSRAMTRG